MSVKRKREFLEYQLIVSSKRSESLGKAHQFKAKKNATLLNANSNESLTSLS